MSAFSEPEVCLPIVRPKGLSPVQFAAVGTALAVLGAVTIWPSLLTLWSMWTTDALKSIGMVIPLVSLVLILRVWKSLGWEVEGSWWGLAVLLIAIVVSQIQRQAVLILVISPEWSTALPPPSLVLLAYGSGAVLLLGGAKLYRAALFPILLLWFANPVPHAFSLWVDLPLQQASAHIARTFAMHLGYTLTPDRLRLMFTPEFGMFIAPGCNGIRGSLTMGFIALIAGYVYRFRWYATAMVMTGAILLGYVFNFARLCLLVLYYAVAMHFTSLQDKAENADYAIGALIFLLATLLLFGVIHRLREADMNERPVTKGTRQAFRDGAPRVGAYALLVTLGLIVLIGCVSAARANAAVRQSAATIVAVRFPQRLGNYTLVRTWDETLTTGTVVYDWAGYAPAGGGTPISIGVSPVLGWHDPLICHAIRGDNPLWQGQLTMITAGTVPINFSSGFYNNGVTQYLEISTQCTGASCGEFATKRTHMGFVYTYPNPKSIFDAGAKRSVPVLVRVETEDMELPAGAARQRLTGMLQGFLSSVKLDDLTRQVGR
jgi:exosortase J